jgi:hypothetical protein
MSKRKLLLLLVAVVLCAPALARAAGSDSDHTASSLSSISVEDLPQTKGQKKADAQWQHYENILRDGTNQDKTNAEMKAPGRRTPRERFKDLGTGKYTLDGKKYIPTANDRSVINQFKTHLQDKDSSIEHGQVYQKGTRDGVRGVHPVYTASGDATGVDLPGSGTRVGRDAHSIIHSHPAVRTFGAFSPPSVPDRAHASELYSFGTKTKAFIHDTGNGKTYKIDPKKNRYHEVSQSRTRSSRPGRPRSVAVHAHHNGGGDRRHGLAVRRRR